jgi:hypothetical protein
MTITSSTLYFRILLFFSVFYDIPRVQERNISNKNTY